MTGTESAPGGVTGSDFLDVAGFLGGAGLHATASATQEAERINEPKTILAL